MMITNKMRKFLGFQLQQTPEEGCSIQQSKCCDDDNKQDEEIPRRLSTTTDT